MRSISKISVQDSSPGIIIDSIIDLLNILAQATSVLVGGINIGGRLIGGKGVLIYVHK